MSVPSGWHLGSHGGLSLYCKVNMIPWFPSFDRLHKQLCYHRSFDLTGYINSCNNSPVPASCLWCTEPVRIMHRFFFNFTVYIVYCTTTLTHPEKANSCHSVLNVSITQTSLQLHLFHDRPLLKLLWCGIVNVSVLYMHSFCTVSTISLRSNTTVL